MMAGHREHSRRLKIHAALSFGYRLCGSNADLRLANIFIV